MENEHQSWTTLVQVSKYGVPQHKIPKVKDSGHHKQRRSESLSSNETSFVSISTFDSANTKEDRDEQSKWEENPADRSVSDKWLDNS